MVRKVHTAELKFAREMYESFVEKLPLIYDGKKLWIHLIKSIDVTAR